MYIKISSRRTKNIKNIVTHFKLCVLTVGQFDGGKWI